MFVKVTIVKFSDNCCLGLVMVGGWGWGSTKELTRLEILEKMSHFSIKCGDPPCGRGIRTRSRCRADGLFSDIFRSTHSCLDIWVPAVCFVRSGRRSNRQNGGATIMCVTEADGAERQSVALMSQLGRENTRGRITPPTHTLHFFHFLTFL